MKISATNRPGAFRHLYASAITLAATLTFLSGCAAHSSYGHPGTGSSVSLRYNYYPDSNVYYDSHRHRYHYHHASHGWVSAKKLPRYTHQNRHRYHVVHKKHHKPWKSKHAHKKHRSHYKGKHSYHHH
mgnify:CR=1 FL=1